MYDFDEILDEVNKTLEWMTEKLDADLLAIQKGKENFKIIYITVIEKHRKLEALMSEKHWDWDLCEATYNEISESKKLLYEQHSLLENLYNAFNHGQLESAELFKDVGEIMINLQKALFNDYEAMIEHKNAKIEKYTKGPKKKSEVSQQKWELAQQYFVEEIPEHKTLKNARKAAANRAGIVVEERQLVKMLPDPR
jgi:hypothetical protein